MHDDLPGLSPALRRIGADLDVAMHASERASAPARRSTRRLRLILRLATAAAAMTIAIAVLATLRSGSPAGVQSAAAAVTGHLARVALAQPAGALGPGQYLHSVARSEAVLAFPAAEHSAACRLRTSETLEDWVAADGAALRRETYGAARYTSPADRLTCRDAPEAAAIRRVSASTETLFGPGGLRLSTVDFAHLPLNPKRLAAKLRTGKVEGGPPGVAEAFAQVADLLRGTDAPPRVRAALFAATAELPRIKSLGTITDTLGRRGVGLALRSGGELRELIFDPRTSALMEEHSTLANAPGGPTFTTTTFLPNRIVSRLPVDVSLPPSGTTKKLSGPSAR